MEVEKFNIKKKLLKEKIIDNRFCNQLNRLTLEEIISLKLIIAAESVKGKLFGFPFTKFVNDITKESLVTFAISMSGSYRQASKILGLSHSELYNFIKKNELYEKYKN